MAASARLDLIRDSDYEQTIDYRRLTRTILVEDLDLSTDSDVQARAVALLAGLSPAIMRGSAHPIQTGNTAGMTVRSIRTVPLGVGDGGALVLCLVTYQVDTPEGPMPEGWSVLPEGSTTLTQELTDTDAAGNRYDVVWWPDPANIGNPAHATARKQGAVVACLKPLSTRHYKKRIVLTGPTDTTIDTLHNFVGKVNSATFKGKAANTVMCWGVTDKCLNPLGLLWEVTVTYVYRPQGWHEWAQYIDPQTGKAPPGSKKNLADPTQAAANVGSNGWRRFTPPEAVDLSTMGF